MNVFAASAPGKAILLGEHGVNRGQPALVAAIDRRVICTVWERSDEGFGFQSGEHQETVDRAALRAFKQEIDEFRATGELDALNARATGFFAPARYVLAHLLERYDVPGLDIRWRSTLPSGSGLGSGAAASAAMVHATLQAAGKATNPADIAWLAWQGDVIAHGGVASGLDSGGCSLGGVTHYTVADGPVAVPAPALRSLVIAHTGIKANTSVINTRVREFLRDQPHRMHLFGDMGLLVAEAQTALTAGDLPRLGHVMNLAQLLLAKLGVSSSEIERLVDAALAGGALGAKLSGSGGGGIVIALPPPDGSGELVAALTAAGGSAELVTAGVPGVRVEAPDASFTETSVRTCM